MKASFLFALNITKSQLILTQKLLAQEKKKSAKYKKEKRNKKQRGGRTESLWSLLRIQPSRGSPSYPVSERTKVRAGNDADVYNNSLAWSVTIISIKLKYKKVTQISKTWRNRSRRSSEAAWCIRNHSRFNHRSTECRPDSWAHS